MLTRGKCLIADIVKMIDSQPDLAPLIRRVRGGYLKIQGTWMPYEVIITLGQQLSRIATDAILHLFFHQVALKLSRRFAHFLIYIKR